MIKIYTTEWCPYCSAAKRLLKEKKKEFDEINIEKEDISRDELAKLTGRGTVPQIVIDGNSIGGYENLVAYVQEGKLK